MAKVIPGMVDALTPNGELPDDDTLRQVDERIEGDCPTCRRRHDTRLTSAVAALGHPLPSNRWRDSCCSPACARPLGSRGSKPTPPRWGNCSTWPPIEFGEDFRRGLTRSAVWVNGDPAESDHALEDGDEVAVIPPVSGGAQAVVSLGSAQVGGGAGRARRTGGGQRLIGQPAFAAALVGVAAVWVLDLKREGAIAGVRLALPAATGDHRRRGSWVHTCSGSPDSGSRRGSPSSPSSAGRCSAPRPAIWRRLTSTAVVGLVSGFGRGFDLSGQGERTMDRS